ncbi:hypothetical protein WJX75_010043 [Coccomyxa subellipsoidea]|uniref:Uncharacterized protein n=1 Tax=Coccomyxa subellipsoidea TaxID=248742 RepID=A0ABR2YWG9_9CHLO
MLAFANNTSRTTATKALASNGSNQADSGSKTLPDDGEIAGSFCFGEAIIQLQLTRGIVRAFTIDTMSTIWKTLVRQMILSLNNLDNAPWDSCFLPYVEEAVYEGVVFLWVLGDFNPRMLQALTTCNVEAPRAASSSSSGNAVDWPAILVRMQLTRRQVEQLVACRRTLINEVAILAVEWDRLWAQLKDIEDVGENAEGSVIRFGEVAALTTQLCANVHAINTCRHFYLSYVYTRTAQFFVASNPMGPDILSLMAFLAIQADEPSTSELLRMAEPGASGGEGTSSGPSLCVAVDWRQALMQPLSVLHGRRTRMDT